MPNRKPELASGHGWTVLSLFLSDKGEMKHHGDLTDIVSPLCSNVPDDYLRLVSPSRPLFGCLYALLDIILTTAYVERADFAEDCV